MAIKEPNIKDVHMEGKLNQDTIEFLTKLRQKVENDSDNRTGWLRKLVTNNNQRIGLKRVSTRPWHGAPNIPLPEADKLIKKKEPNFVLSAFLPKQKAFVRVQEGVQMTPELKDKAQKAEKGLNHVLNHKNDLMEVFSLASDNFLEKGHALFKVIEQFKKVKVNKVIALDDFPKEAIKTLKKFKNSELALFIADRFGLDNEDEEDKAIIDDVVAQFRSGKNVVEFTMFNIESFPKIIVRPAEKVTPPSYALLIENVERLKDEFFLTKRELVDNAHDGIYDKKVIDRLKEIDFSGKGKSVNEDDLIDSQKERNEGVIDEGEDELFKMEEIYVWWQKDKDKPFERWVFTFLSDVGGIEDSLVQMIRFPYELDTWNWVKHDNEIKDTRWHASRGLPEQIRALQEFMEKSINNMLIRDQINNNPTYTVLGHSNIMSNTLRFIPGQKLKVKAHDEIKKLDDNSKVDLSSERINNLLKAYTEEYAGSTDQLFRNATNEGGGKTLGEVKIGVQLASGPVTLEVARWFITLKKIYTMMFKLLRERMGESMFIDGLEITREDFNFEADVMPNGSIDLAEQNVRVQKAFNRLNVSMTLPPEISTVDDKYNAAFDFYEADGVKDPDRYVTNPEITQQAEQQQMAQEDKVLAQQEQQLEGEIANKRAAIAATGGEGGQREPAKPRTA